MDRAAGRAKSPLTQNCSGKHAAMLATCVVNGWDTATYRDPEHPLQQRDHRDPRRADRRAGRRRRRRRLRRAACMPSRWPGWPAPSAGSPPRRRGSAEARVADAIRAYPDYLGGTGRDVTASIREADRARRQGRRRVRCMPWACPTAAASP